MVVATTKCESAFIILGCAFKPCTVGVHMQSKMKVLGTFGGHEMRGKNTHASLKTLVPMFFCK